MPNAGLLERVKMLSSCALHETPCLSALLSKLVNRNCLPRALQSVPPPLARRHLASIPLNCQAFQAPTSDQASRPSSFCKVSSFSPRLCGTVNLRGNNPSLFDQEERKRLKSNREVFGLRTMATSSAGAAGTANAETSQHKHTNRLAKEESPYLLQHAHNPGGLAHHHLINAPLSPYMIGYLEQAEKHVDGIIPEAFFPHLGADLGSTICFTDKMCNI